MGSIIGSKKSQGSYINGQLQFKDIGWVPLKLGPNVTGFAFFKDNNDGTCLVSGAADVATTINGVLVYAPSGYKFSSVPGDGTLGGMTGEYPLTGVLSIDGTGNLACRSDSGFDFIFNAPMTAYYENWGTAAKMKIVKV